jgi:hypothetical protein
MNNLLVLVVKENYVINRIVISAEDYATYTYPHPHDTLMIAKEYDDDGNKIWHYTAQIGDWWEEAEGIFYRPLGTPPDLPEELQQ